MNEIYAKEKGFKYAIKTKYFGIQYYRYLDSLLTAYSINPDIEIIIL